MNTLTKEKIRLAILIAAIADLIQIVFAPIFIPGSLSLLNDALDLAVFVLLTKLIGWHWALVPAGLCEMAPILDEIPTWTAAAYFATRGLNSISQNN